MKKFLLAAAGAATLAFAAAPASALIYIGVSTDGGGTINTVATGANSASITNLVVGAFDINSIQGQIGFGQTLLDSGSINTNSAGAGTIDIYVSRDDITGPPSLLPFFSSFTTNQLQNSFVRFRTYADVNNVAYGQTQLLADMTMAVSNTTFTAVSPAVIGAGDYSVTERYTVTTTGAGQANSTAFLSVVPEPTSWALMIVGFGAAGAMVRSRRRAAVPA